ncbi:hypothetical protein HanIR_Chr05g0227191 [Helianthus annuus]|nr:hypothetical protein HanIR_Chr05g0227191 [Helianthus annuus]
MIWAWLCDNQSMPNTISNPNNFKGSKDIGKEWFLMDIKHPSKTVEAVSKVPSANSTSYFTLKVLTGKFNNLQNLSSTNDLSAPESNSTLAYTSFMEGTCDHVVVLNRLLYVHLEDPSIGLLGFLRLLGVFRAVSLNVPFLVTAVTGSIFNSLVVNSLVLSRLAHPHAGGPD